MIYLICFLGTFIVMTLIFIFSVFRWLIEKLEIYSMLQFTTAPMIIDRTYRGRDFFASFIYSTKEAMMRNAYPRNPDEIIIMDEEHRNHIIKEYSRGLVDEMFKTGCIEIKEEDDNLMPFQKRVDLKVKVYQPEN